MEMATNGRLLNGPEGARFPLNRLNGRRSATSGAGWPRSERAAHAAVAGFPRRRKELQAGCLPRLAKRENEIAGWLKCAANATGQDAWCLRACAIIAGPSKYLRVASGL
jgi:hypothetical protein